MDGLRLPRAQRRRSHRPRLRRERLGEPVQIDGFEHRWFEGEPSRRRRSERGGERPPRTRLVFIDDATSPLMRVRFVLSESTFAHLDALEGHLAAHGRPVALAIVLGPMADEGSHPDENAVVRVAKRDARSGCGVTQFGRALAALRVEIGVRPLETGQGPRRAREPHPAGPARAEDVPGRHLRHRRGERAPSPASWSATTRASPRRPPGP